MSTFSGRINEIDGISVDRFDCDNLDSTAYFLSHCHTDHMAGIRTECFLNRLADNPQINLYCSPITSLILKLSGLASVSHKIIGLPIGPANMVVVPGGQDGGKILTVSLIPAGHCPGSVMFLFEGDCGKIVYTGDFRISSQDVQNMHQFYDSHGQVKRISKVYIDTTFIGLYGTKFAEFPTRKESSDEVIRLASQWLLKGSNHVVNLFTSARYGSEYLLLDIATKLCTRIRVPDLNYKVYSAIPDISWAVTDDPGARIQSLGRGDIQSIRDCSSVYTTTLEPQLRTIKPAALWWCHSQSKDLTISCGRGEFYRVMYACHSSPQEIKSFIHFLRPEALEPCVIPDNFTYDKVVSICQMIMEEARPIPRCLPNSLEPTMWQAESSALTSTVDPYMVHDSRHIVFELGSPTSSPTYKMFNSGNTP